MKTVLYDRHIALGAKMVDFSGWSMPVFYKGVVPEHHAVRKHAGIFDISHMGRIKVFGPAAEEFLDFLSTNTIKGKAPGSATYTVWANDKGGSVDDVIVYKEDATHFFVVVNAGNRQVDLDHLHHYGTNFEVSIEDCFDSEGMLAIQGPEALEIGQRILPQLNGLAPMHFIKSFYHHHEIFLSGTGYTGAGGFEVYAPKDVIVDLWDRFLNLGAVPVGLGARDTLRMEMGYALYGHELTPAIAPNESVAAWTVHLTKKSFVGEAQIRSLEKAEYKRAAQGIILLDKGVLREGYDVYDHGNKIGVLTSGTFSPTLNTGIGIALMDKKLKTGTEVNVLIRERPIKAKIVKLPFIKTLDKIHE